jgi:hypothetical protein
MNNIESKLSQLKNKLESTAFLVSTNVGAKQIHSEIVQSLVLLSELETLYLSNGKKDSVFDSDSKEINKVNRKLKKWAKSPNQINSKILNAFLRLERSGVSVITESGLKEISDVSTFENNFIQMKVIAENNHCKVFEQYGDEVTLWKPIIPYVREYEKVVFD